MKESFRVSHSNLYIETDDAHSDYDVVDIPGKISMAHRVRDNDVRRTFAEFGRCFLAGSIFGGSLRVTSSITAVSKLSEEFDRYTQCNHDNKSVCSDCRKNLLLAGTSTEELIPSGGRLAVAISNVTSRNESVLLKSLS